MKRRIKVVWDFGPVFMKGRLRYHIRPQMCTDTAFALSQPAARDVQMYLLRRIDDEADRLERLALGY